jgi:hypothetical protein
MANGHGERARRRPKSDGRLDENPYESSGKEAITQQPPEKDVTHRGRTRVERPDRNTTARGSTATLKMTSESQTTLPSLRSGSSHKRRRRKEHREDSKEVEHHRSRKSTAGDGSRHVYSTRTDPSQSSRITISDTLKIETRASSQDGETSDSEASSKGSEPAKPRPRKRKIRVIYITEEKSEVAKPRERRARPEKEPKDRLKESGESIRSSRTSHSRRKSAAHTPPLSPPRRHDILPFCGFWL